MPDQTKFTNKLHGTRILIIGGSSGLGYAVAEAAIEYKAAKVILSSSRDSRVQSSIQRLKSSYPSSTTELQGFACNLGDESSLESNLENLFKQTGPLDHIIHTAGDSLAITKLSTITMESAKQAGMVRFFAPLFVAKYGSQVLSKSASSSITLTTGSVSQKPNPDWVLPGSYATALQGLTRGLALDLKPIRVNLIAPGGVDTEMWHDKPEKDHAALLQNMAKRTALGKVGKPEEVAEAYIYCMRDTNVTGSILSTNGGSLIM